MNGFDFFLQALAGSAEDTNEAVTAPKTPPKKVVASEEPTRPAEHSLGNVAFLSARRKNAA